MRYLMAYVPRSGSWLLTNALIRTGVAGIVREPFGVDMSRQEKPIPDLDYLVKACRDCRTDNGTSGLRVHWRDWVNLASRLNLTPADLHYLLGEPKWILTLRRDRLRQAVSFVKAVQTREWWRRADKTCGNGREPVYDRDAIKKAIADFEAQEQSWLDYFKSIRGQPKAVYYEEIDSDYEATVRDTLVFLGIKPRRCIPPPRLLRQADGVNEEWVERFLRGE